MRFLYEQLGLPVMQNRVYDSAAQARACPTGDMRLVEDRETGLIYNAAFDPDLLAYDDQYQNEQALSGVFRQHLETVADLVAEGLGTHELVEVGCGKGYFLELLAGKGFDITGFDPAYEGSNPRVRKQAFAPGVMHAGRGLILRHVLEHMRDPYGFLEELRVANGGGGRIYIEVPCFDWICEHRAWFDIFYEHVNYFRLTDFHRLFGEVLASGRLFGGQYLYAIADLATLRRPRAQADDRAALPADFLQRVVAGGPCSGAATESAIWGGASKGVIFALLRQRAGFPGSRVIDINPAKQGGYLPATGLRVESPQEALPTLAPGATIFVMNSNYLEEIRKMSNNAYHYIGVDHG